MAKKTLFFLVPDICRHLGGLHAYYCTTHAPLFFLPEVADVPSSPPPTESCGWLTISALTTLDATSISGFVSTTPARSAATR